MYLFRLCKSTAKYSFLIKKFVLLKIIILFCISSTHHKLLPKYYISNDRIKSIQILTFKSLFFQWLFTNQKTLLIIFKIKEILDQIKHF